MNKVFVIIYKSPLSVHCYGSLKALFDEHGGVIKKSLQSFRNKYKDYINLDLEDYQQPDLVIGQRSVIRSKQNIL